LDPVCSVQSYLNLNKTTLSNLYYISLGIGYYNITKEQQKIRDQQKELGIKLINYNLNMDEYWNFADAYYS
jgi:hypothetical protein